VAEKRADQGQKACRPSRVPGPYQRLEEAHVSRKAPACNAPPEHHAVVIEILHAALAGGTVVEAHTFANIPRTSSDRAARRVLATIPPDQTPDAVRAVALDDVVARAPALRLLGQLPGAELLRHRWGHWEAPVLGASDRSRVAEEQTA